MSETTAKKKGKLAVYWAASCGGCEISMLAINEKILDVAEAFDIVFWPCICDGKVHDVEKMADGEIDVCLFNGGIRTSEQEYMAQLLRRKSKVLVAFGSCAPGRLHPRPGQHEQPQADASTRSTRRPPRPRIPRTSARSTKPTMPEGTLHLPIFYDTLKTLDQTVEVDYYLPGCPPEADRIWDAIVAILEGKLPAAGLGDRQRTRPSATSARGSETKRRSRSSTAPGRSFPTRRRACWSRGCSAAGWPRGRAAERYARRSTRRASAATARTTTSTTSAPG